MNMSKTLGKYNKLYCKQPTYDGEVCVVRHVFGDSVAEEVGLVDQLDGTGQDGPHLVLNTLIKRKHRVSKKLYIHTFTIMDKSRFVHHVKCCVRYRNPLQIPSLPSSFFPISFFPTGFGVAGESLRVESRCSR